MSKTKIVRPYEDDIDMIMTRERMPATGVYYTVKSTPSNMDDSYEHFIDYR